MVSGNCIQQPLGQAGEDSWSNQDLFDTRGPSLIRKTADYLVHGVGSDARPARERRDRQACHSPLFNHAAHRLLEAWCLRPLLIETLKACPSDARPHATPRRLRIEHVATTDRDRR